MNEQKYKWVNLNNSIIPYTVSQLFNLTFLKELFINSS